MRPEKARQKRFGTGFARGSGSGKTPLVAIHLGGDLRYTLCSTEHLFNTCVFPKSTALHFTMSQGKLRPPIRLFPNPNLEPEPI